MSPEINFLGMGLISLLLNTIKDYQSLRIDSTKNFVMTGVVLGFYLFTNADLLFLFAGVVIVGVFNHLTKRIFGAGDQEALYWIVPGLLCIGAWQVLIFSTFLFFFTGVYSLLRSWQKVAPETKTPGFVVLFGAFLLTAGIYLFNTL